MRTRIAKPTSLARFHKRLLSHGNHVVETRFEKAKNILEIIYKVVSIIAILIAGGWALYHFVLTGERDSNIELVLTTEQIKLNEKSNLLVVHAHPINRGKVPVEIGGEEGGSFRITVKKIQQTKSGEWIDQEKLPIFKEVDILRHHKDGYVLEPNGTYDDVESIELPNGIYHLEANFDMKDDYFNVYSILKIGSDRGK